MPIMAAVRGIPFPNTDNFIFKGGISTHVAIKPQNYFYYCPKGEIFRFTAIADIALGHTICVSLPRLASGEAWLRLPPEVGLRRAVTASLA
jgi:hypothetical protein